MKKAKKIFWSAVVLLFVLIVAAIVVVASRLDDIVKKGVETVGPKITQTSVTLSEVHLSLFAGSASVKQLVVGNPAGYKSSFAISVGTADLGVNPLSICSDKIVIRSVRVEAPEITFEGNPLSKNNLGDIMDNVDQVAKNGGPAPAGTNTVAAARNKPGKKIEVDDLVINGAKVHAMLPSVGNFSGRELTLTLPQIHLTNLGKGGDGITATELTRAVLNAITTATIKAVADAGWDKSLKNLGGNAGEGIDQIKKSVGGLLGK
jgi:AsmA family